jgi:hypothetical protein
MRIRLTVAGLVAALVAGLGLPVVAGSGSPPSAGHGYVSADAVRSGAPIHGMIVADANKPFDVGLPDLQHLADDGVNQVTFYITWYFPSLSSASISRGPYTPTDQEVSTAIQLAHQAGLTVQIDPILWLSPATPGRWHWRGLLNPSDQDAFWANYDALILRYADLAQREGVEMMAIGSELTALERHTSRWTSLAASVRAAYSGRLTYMAINRSIKQVHFWRSVDYIGISPYYYLSDHWVPSYAELRAAWGRYFPALHRLSQRVHRPVLFNEIGYLSAEAATARPWESHTARAASQTVQARAYAALLDAARDQAWLHGISFYVWSPLTTPTDKTFSPRDKRAECELATRWASASAPRLPDGKPVGCLGAEAANTSALP